MPLLRFEDLPDEMLRCPCREHGPLVRHGDRILCRAQTCRFAEVSFPQIHSRPVLMPFGREATLFNAADYATALDQDLFVERREGRLAGRLRKLIYGRSRHTRENVDRLCDMLPAGAQVLVVGSGTRGVGMERLWTADLAVTGIDVYPSSSVTLLADGHHLPFADGSFDAVIIQAVLEHVLEPAQVVAELHRVLKDTGLVYAETPFMQQVHEGAYDFQRFTVSGHRWLFREFRALHSGPNRGPAVGFCWALKYLTWGLLRSRVAGTLVYAASYPVARLLDRLVPQRFRVDSASGVFFLGRKEAGYALRPEEILDFYRGAQRRQPAD